MSFEVFLEFCYICFVMSVFVIALCAINWVFELAYTYSSRFRSWVDKFMGNEAMK